ncbi:unnamed protein product [Chrysoparadoxa australica]
MDQSSTSTGAYRNKQRVLVFCSRGINSRHRHLMEDVRRLLPHHKKDVKLDIGKGESLNAAINTIAEMKTCNSTLFFESRKKQDLYLWMGRTPQGPSAKFHVMNIHTMDELKLTGNSLKGSRPLLNFDAAFNGAPQWQILKTMLIDVFGTPRGHPKSKPFIDRIMSFYVCDGKIWVRNYQILDKGPGGSLEKKLESKGEEFVSLVEMGPRLVLTPIRIFSGSFGGATLYQNPAYVSPNTVRASKRREKGAKYENRTEAKLQTRAKREERGVPELDDVLREQFK